MTCVHVDFFCEQQKMLLHHMISKKNSSSRHHWTSFHTVLPRQELTKGLRRKHARQSTADEEVRSRKCLQHSKIIIIYVLRTYISCMHAYRPPPRKSLQTPPQKKRQKYEYLCNGCESDFHTLNLFYSIPDLSTVRVSCCSEKIPQCAGPPYIYIYVCK